MAKAFSFTTLLVTAALALVAPRTSYAQGKPTSVMCFCTNLSLCNIPLGSNQQFALTDVTVANNGQEQEGITLVAIDGGGQTYKAAYALATPKTVTQSFQTPILFGPNATLKATCTVGDSEVDYLDFL